MTLEEFLRYREIERAWVFANGLNNGEASTNGEFACLDLLLQEADVFVDVGANTGEFSARAAARNPPPAIVAFEPNPQHRPRLEGRLAGVGRLEPVALGDAEGTATLHIHPVHHAAAGLHDRPRMSASFRAEMRKVDVPVRRLDSYYELSDAQRLVIKIDAEGFELPVMRGADLLVAGDRPCAVMFEHSFAWLETRESLLDAFQLFDGCGFQFFRILPFGLEHIRFFKNRMERAQYCNYVAVRGFDLLERPRAVLPTFYGQTTLIPFG